MREFFEECRKCKETLNTNACNNAYLKVKLRNIIGDLSYLYKKYKPTDYTDFYTKYTNDTVGDDPRHRGRSNAEIRNVAEKWRALSHSNLDVEIFYKALIFYIICATFDGHKFELDFMDYIKSKGYTVTTSDPEIDAKFGVDLVLDNFFIQIKPVTFFIGDYNQSLLIDRRIAIEKYYKTYSTFKKPTYFAIYRKTDNGVQWLLNKNNKYTHKISDLLNIDGTTKLIYKD